MGDEFRAPKNLDNYADDSDFPDDEASRKVKPAASFQRNQIQLGDVSIPPLLLRPLLRHFHPDSGSIPTIRGDDRRKNLLKNARQLKNIGAAYDEMIAATWIRNLQRCSPALSSDAIEEIVSQAMVGDVGVDTLEFVSKTFGKWRYTPAESRLYYEDELPIALNQNQIWTFDFLIDRYEQNLKITRNDDVVAWLNNRLERFNQAEAYKASKGLPSEKLRTKASRDLRDWAFRSERQSDHLIGNGRLVSTGDGEVRLNFDWNPYEDPKVGKIFSSR